MEEQSFLKVSTQEPFLKLFSIEPQFFKFLASSQLFKEFFLLPLVTNILEDILADKVNKLV